MLRAAGVSRAPSHRASSSLTSDSRFPQPDLKIKETLGTFWNDRTIQEFWSGQSFHRMDEGQMQSYHLAKVLTRKLTGDLPRFRSFLRAADFRDAGTAALVEHYGLSPAGLVEDYLGDGNWAPLPSAAPD